MDMRIRKLFPNQTVACPDFCDPECPIDCYHPFPDISFPPPPLPPPYSDQNHHIPTSVIIVVSLLSIFFLAVGYYVVKGKSCPSWCCKSNGQPPSSQSDGSDEEFIDGNQVDHHIWFITTVGLQPSVISSITICKYKKGEGLIEGTECSVCLSEFQENETLRLLPKCSHAFHISCIDYWLRSHTNCPLCRARIVSGTVGVDDSGANEDAQMENSDNQVGNSAICENRAGTEDLNAETQAVRRAVSVDSCADLSIGVCVDDQTEEFEKSDSDIAEKQEGGLMGSSSIGQRLHKSPASLRRSFSCDGRFSSPRQNRSLNSILPL